MQDSTRCVRARPATTEGFESLAVPVYRGSTIVFRDAAEYATRLQRGPDGYTYGLHGTPTSRTLEAQIAALENARRCLLAPSGMAAIAVAMLTLLRHGDHVLIADTAYPPTREFADNALAGFGIDCSYYDPQEPGSVAAAMRPSTRLVWVESPGSSTMEFQDLPAIARIAHEAGALVGCDNTWASPLLFKPLDHGADLVVEAITKYIGGHSDLLMGCVSMTDMDLFRRCKATMNFLGYGVSPDDCSLALRGLQTLAVRLRQAGETAWTLAQWLRAQPAVDRVLHPGLPECPGHAVWKRDFRGASGVFSFTLRPGLEAGLAGALDQLRLFSIGASWGGTHSLVAPMNVDAARTATRAPAGPIVRLSIGLEDAADLQDDLAAFTAHLEAQA